MNIYVPRNNKNKTRYFIEIGSNKKRIIDALDPFKASHSIGFNALYIFLLFSVISDQNEVTLYNVSRYTPRRYECIASNGYPPDVARSFQLTIQYPPELTLVFLSKINEELTSSVFLIDLQQNDIRLKCRILINPIGKITWMKDNTKLVNNHQIHQYQSIHMENYVIAELVIKEFSYDDQGEYACVASNSLGTNSKSIQLLLTPTTTSTTTMELVTSRLVLPRRKRPKHTRTTTTIVPEEFNPSTEIFREMSISTSQGK